MSAAQRETIGELLSAYLDGEVSDEQRAQIEALLETDAAARALLTELEQAAAAVRSLPRGATPPSVLEDITARVEREELLGSADDQVTLERHKRGPFRSSLAVAAMLFIAVGGTLYVSSELVRTQTPSAKPLARGRSPQPVPGRADEASRLERDTQGEKGAGRDKKSAPADQSADTHPPQRDWEALKKRLTEPESNQLDAPTYVAKTPAEEVPEVESKELDVGAMKSADVAGAPPEPQLALAEREDTARLGIIKRGKGEAPSATVVHDTEVPAGVGGSIERATDVPQPVPLTRDESDLSSEVMTLEQKLAVGKDLTAIKAHRFENEPLQLAVTFANHGRQEEFDNQLKLFFARSRLRPVDRTLRAGDLLTRREVDDLLDLPTGAGATPTKAAPVFFEGGSTSNFAPRVAGEQQDLIRMPTSALGELIAMASSENVEGIRLGIGMLAAEGAADVQRLAGQTLAYEAGYSHDDSEPAAAPADMMELLEKTGLVPPDILEDSPLSAQRPAAAEARARGRGASAEVPPEGHPSAPSKTHALRNEAKDAEVSREVDRVARPEAATEQLITLVIQMAPAERPTTTQAATQPATMPARVERAEGE